MTNEIQDIVRKGAVAARLADAACAAYAALEVHCPGTAAQKMLKHALTAYGYDVACADMARGIAYHKKRQCRCVTP